MSKVCEVCGKHPVAGRSISHSHRVTNRKFRHNIQRVYVVVDGHRQDERLLHLPQVRQGCALLNKVLPTSTSDSPGQRPRVHIELTKGALPYGGRLLHSLGTHWGQTYMSAFTHWGQT